MSKGRILALGAALTLPLLAQGKLAFPVDAFGRLEAGLDFCSQTVPESADKFQEAKKVLTQGATDEEVATARASKEYIAAYDETTESMKKQPKAQVAKTCAAALETKQ